jgi:hypothetical protein
MANFEFDLPALVRIALNDPTSRAQIEAALEAGPLAVREPAIQVREGDKLFVARVKTDRDKNPGDEGFLVRNEHGWFYGALTEVVISDHDAKTMSQTELARKLGISIEELASRLKPNV